MSAGILLQRGTLWKKLIKQTQYALQTGALQSIPTDYEFIEQSGINFLVRTIANLVRKDVDTSRDQDFNPFLPYDQDLFVADISDTHLCLLNKFNVVEHHLLIVTRAFEDQETWLTQQDFAAMLTTLAEIDGLAFYNGGKIAGASQKHKHLQLVPLPFVPQGAKIPIESAITAAQYTNAIGTIPAFPFVHAIALLNFDGQDLATASLSMQECYHRLLRIVGLDCQSSSSHGAYNLLVTRKWMLVIARSQESFENISVNALGFAGSLFVKDTTQMQILKAHGPITILQNVAISR